MRFMMKESIGKRLRGLRIDRERIIQCVPALAIFLLVTYRLSDIGQPILFNDEIGYWSNSGFFLGIDWTSVTGNISYYSYGYSLLLVPLRLLSGLLGWRWDTLYQAAVVLNGLMLMAGYGLALKLSGRYLPGMNTYVRILACFAVFTYSSLIVYSHITWTETTLTVMFWLFLYVMMRVIDRPGMANHAAFALLSLYMYTVHQRTLGIVVTAVILVICLRLAGYNRIGHTAVFFACLYLGGIVHSAVKKNLQTVNYLGGEPLSAAELFGGSSGAAALAAGAVVIGALAVLFLLDRGRKKAAVGLVIAGAAAAACLGYGILMRATPSGETVKRISVNDFSGQWNVIRNLFSLRGLARLGISIAGKWFYLAASTGFVICWAIVGLVKNALALAQRCVTGARPSPARDVDADTGT